MAFLDTSGLNIGRARLVDAVTSTDSEIVGSDENCQG